MNIKESNYNKCTVEYARKVLNTLIPNMPNRTYFVKNGKIYYEDKDELYESNRRK